VSDARRRVCVYPQRHATVKGVFLILLYFALARTLLSAIFDPRMLAGPFWRRPLLTQLDEL